MLKSHRLSQNHIKKTFLSFNVNKKSTFLWTVLELNIHGFYWFFNEKLCNIVSGAVFKKIVCWKWVRSVKFNLVRHFGHDYNSILGWKFQLFCELRLSQSYMITIVFTVADDVTVTQWQFFEISFVFGDTFLYLKKLPTVEIKKSNVVFMESLI